MPKNSLWSSLYIGFAIDVLPQPLGRGNFTTCVLHRIASPLCPTAAAAPLFVCVCVCVCRCELWCLYMWVLRCVWVCAQFS